MSILLDILVSFLMSIKQMLLLRYTLFISLIGHRQWYACRFALFGELYGVFKAACVFFCSTQECRCS